MSEKTYINHIYFKTRQTNFGDVLKVSVKVSDFIEELQKYANESGYVNFDILKRKEVDKKGNTHYAVLDTWKPEPKQGTTPVAEHTQSKDELPF